MTEKLFLKKLPLDEFLKSDFVVEDDLSHSWFHRSFFAQMLDIWAEVDELKEIGKKYLSQKDNETLAWVIKKLNGIHKLCQRVYLNPDILEGAKWSLKFAEWELLDFYLWDNQLSNTIDTINFWFDQFCYDINYDLLA